MSRVFFPVPCSLFRFPRVSGDEPVLGRETVAQIVFSPRERG